MSPLVDWIQRSGGTGRFLVLGVAAAVVVSVWAVGHWASAPMYVTLYRDLEFSEVADIEKSLEDAGIPHRLGAAGTAVLVPATEAARARVALAKSGNTVGSRPGLELFDKPAWGMTEFTQRVTYQRALEGELARTIANIHGVERAQVHMAVPSRSPLQRNQHDGSASVVLTLRPGTSLSPETVQGISYIVSNSVDRLPAENVAIMDDSGRVLSVPSGGRGETGASSRQAEIRRSVEKMLTDKIQNLLEPVLGPGHVRAQVAAQLSFDQVDRTVERIGSSPADSTSAATASGTATATVNSHEIQRSRKSVGDITRLTAAVLIDETALKGNNGENKQGEESPAGGLTLDQAQAMIRDAIGIDESRGDRLTVSAVPFEPAAVPEPGAGATSGGGGPGILGMVQSLIRPVVGIFAILVLALLALKVMKIRPAPAPPRLEEVPRAETSSPEAPATAVGTGTVGLAPAGEEKAAGLQVVRGWLKES